jgi:hypothetical protein
MGRVVARCGALRPAGRSSAAAAKRWLDLPRIDHFQQSGFKRERRLNASFSVFCESPKWECATSTAGCLFEGQKVSPSRPVRDETFT